MPRSPAVYVGDKAEKGRGLFAGRGFARGDCVLADLVVLVAEGDVREGSTISNYLILWNDEYEAISFGPSSFLNHAEVPNCHLESDFAAREIRLIADRDIAENDELTIRYRCPLWFDAVA